MVSWLLGSLMALASMPAAASSTPPSPPPAPRVSPQFRRYGVADGLPGSAVNAVMQDRDGMMWFGGSGGLSRFDGVSFTAYVHEPGRADSLGSQDITQLVPAPGGELWIGTGDAGLDRLDPATGRVRHWRHDPQRPHSLADDVVYALAAGADGSLWIGTAAGLDHLAADGRSLVHVPYLDAFGGDPATRDAVVGALRVEADGTLWIGTWSGVLLRRSVDGRITRVPLRDDVGKPNQIWRIEGEGADLRIATRLGLYRLDGKVAVPAYARGEMAPGYVFASARDRAGRLWMATLHGVVLDDPHGGGLRAFHRQPLLRGGLPGEWTWRVLADREGGIWLTFYDGGVAYLPPTWPNVARFTHVPDMPDSLGDTQAAVVAPAAQSGRLWVGLHGRIDRLDPATGRAEHVVEGLRTEPVSLLEQDGALWFTLRGELRRYADGRTQRVDPARRWLTRPEMLAAGEPGTIYASVAGAGVVRIDTHTRAIAPVPMPPDADQPDLRPAALGMHGGALWYANHEGLMWRAPAAAGFAFVPGVARGEDVGGLTFDGDGFWLVRRDTLEHYRWDGQTALRDRVLGAAAGWRAPVVRGLHADADGGLWLFTETGLLRLDPGAGTLRRIGPQDGLDEGEFLNDAVTLGDGAALYAPARSGVLAFDPARLGHAAAATAADRPPVRVAQVQVHGPTGLRTPAGDAPLTLGWRDRDLRVQARVGSFIYPPGNRYRFRLDGLDADWVAVGAHGEREFAGLGAGDYRLQVQAAAPGGPWASLATPLAIHVQPPPWQSGWAWLGYALLAVGLAAAIALAWRRRVAQRLRMQLAEQQRRLAEQASAAKSRFLAELSHEIRTPMTGVIGMAELMLASPLQPAQREYAHAMQRSGAMLLRLLNDALDLARIETGHLVLEPAPFDPRQLVADVARLVEGQARAKGLAFVTEIAADLPARLDGDALRIEQVLLNLAANAVKFTERGRVTLGAHRTRDGVVFSVADSGPGIPAGQQARLFRPYEQGDGPQRRAGSGLGLAICRELVQLMDGRLDLESRPGQGSTFRVRLPLAELAAAPRPGRGADLASTPLAVLLVEDDLTVAAVIAGLLERQGHRVAQATNVLQALAELSGQAFDVMLLDLDLPGVDGYRLARMVREREDEGARLPIVAITARSGGDEEARARAAGMDGFLRKPLSGEGLARAMAMARAAAMALPA